MLFTGDYHIYAVYESQVISAHTSQYTLGVQQSSASVMHHVIFSNLGLTNPPMLLIQPGRLGKLETNRSLRLGLVDSLWLLHVDPAVSLSAGWWALGTMCTTIMVLSTLALVLRQHFFSRVKT